MSAVNAGTDETMARRVAGNSLWLIFQPLLLNAISVVSTGYIARKLGAADYGTFNLGYAQIALFSPLCNLGVRAVAVRAVAQDRARAPEIIRAVFALRLLTTALAILLALAWLALPAYSTATRLIGLAAIASMVCTSIGTVAVDLFQGFERSRLAAQPQIAGGLAITALSVIALLTGLGLPGFTVAYVLGAVFQVWMLLRTARQTLFALRPGWDWPLIRDLLRQTRPFAGMSVVGGMLEPAVLDVMILGALLGSGAVGPYTAAIGLVARLMTIPMGIGDAIYPAIASGHAEGRPELEMTVRRYVLNLLLVTTPIALCLSFTAPTVLWLLFGEQYLSAVGVLRAAAWLIPLKGLAYLAGECLSAIHRQDVVLRLTLVGGAVTAVLCLFLIPAMGPLGAALALVLREAVMAVLWIAELSRAFPEPLPPRDLGRMVLALGAMALPLAALLLHYTHLAAVAGAPGSFLFYGLASVPLGLVNPQGLRGFRRRRV